VAVEPELSHTHNDGVKYVIDTAAPRPARRPRILLSALAVAGLLALSACATPAGGASPSPTATEVTVSPTASPTTSETPTPSTSPTATAEPFNGQILIVTSEVRDGNLEVTAMVPDVSESGGTCTLTVQSSKASVSVEAREGKDVTYCGLMSVPVSASTDDVAFTVGYSSATVKAQSAVTTVEPSS